MRTVSRCLFGAAFASVAATGGAVAADLGTAPVYKAPPPVAVWSWTGAYVGLNAGWGWNNDNGNLFCVTPGGVRNGAPCGAIAAGLQGNTSGNGFVGGGQIGYNWQVGQFVWGIEADFQGADIRGSATPVFSPGIFAVSNQKIDSIGTVRGRLGLAAFDHAMIYATGGLAYGQIRADTNSVIGATSFPASGTFEKVGWTVGGGVEYAISPSWSAKIEGLYYDLGNETLVTTGVPVPNGFLWGKDFSQKGEIVRFGVNYHFGGGPVVAKY